jgi:hypothetical protein
MVLFKPYLVAETLRCNYGDFIANALIRLEVEGELGVVSLNDDLGGFLDCFCSNATHFDRCTKAVVLEVRGVVD